MRTVLIAAVLLTFSPTLLYVSRFFRDDIYITVWTLTNVICIWRYLEEQKGLYLYVLAGAMAFRLRLDGDYLHPRRDHPCLHRPDARCRAERAAVGARITASTLPVS